MMSRFLFGCAVVLGGCGGPSAPVAAAPPAPSAASPPPAATSAPPAPATSVTTSVAPKAACFSKGAVDAPISTFELHGLPTLCIGAESEPLPVCLSFDPKTAKYARVEGFVSTPSDEPQAPFELSTDGANAKVCSMGASSKCTTLKAGFKPREGHGFDGGVSDDGKTALLYRYVASAKKSDMIAQHKVFGELFDVATGKKTASFALPTGTADKPGMFADQSDTWSARFFGRHVVLFAYRCCGPAGAQAFLDTKTGKLHPIGDPSLFEMLSDDTFLVGNEERAYDKEFKQIGTVVLDVFDAKTFTKKRLALPSKPRPEPETHVLASVKLAAGTMALAFANPPGIVPFDPKSATLGTPTMAPICP